MWNKWIVVPFLLNHSLVVDGTFLGNHLPGEDSDGSSHSV